MKRYFVIALLLQLACVAATSLAQIESGSGWQHSFKAGVIDPAKVTRIAIQNAVSIGALMLTTMTVITDLKDKEKTIEGSVR